MKMDPRGNPFEIANAGIDNGVLAQREGWQVNPAYYENPMDPQLVVDVATFQADTRSGRVPGVGQLVVDGRLGPKTKAAIRTVSAGARREAGAVGPEDWPEWWANALSFTSKVIVVEAGESIDGPGEIVIEEVIDIPDPLVPVANGGGGGGLWKVGLMALGLWAAFGG